MVHIKEPLLLIGKSSPCSGGSGFPLSQSEWYFIIICPTPYNRKLKNVFSASLNKTFPSFLDHIDTNNAPSYSSISHTHTHARASSFFLFLFYSHARTHTRTHTHTHTHVHTHTHTHTPNTLQTPI